MSKSIEINRSLWNKLKTFLPDTYEANNLVELAEKQNQIKKSEELIRKEIQKLEEDKIPLNLL